MGEINYNCYRPAYSLFLLRYPLFSMWICKKTVSQRTSCFVVKQVHSCSILWIQRNGIICHTLIVQMELTDEILNWFRIASHIPPDLKGNTSSCIVATRSLCYTGRKVFIPPPVDSEPFSLFKYYTILDIKTVGGKKSKILS